MGFTRLFPLDKAYKEGKTGLPYKKGKKWITLQKREKLDYLLYIFEYRNDI